MPRPTAKQAKQKRYPKGKQPATRYRRPPHVEDGEIIGPEPPDRGPGSAPPPSEPPPIEDHGIPGLPPELASQIDKIIRQYPGAAGERRAIQYLMTTPWFKTEYAGFDQGFAKGMFGDPFAGGLAQYRAYKGEAQRIHRQYYGSELTVQDITGYITQGYDPGRVERIGQGYTIARAQAPEWSYLTGAFGEGALTEEEKRAYGEQEAGISSELGLRIQNRVQTAVQRMQRVFQGTVGSSALGDQALGQRLQRRPDIQA